MPEKDTGQEKSDKDEWNRLGLRWIGVGVEFVVVVGVFSYGGYWLDKIGDSSPGFLILGFLFGFAFMLYTMIKRAGGIKW